MTAAAIGGFAVFFISNWNHFGDIWMILPQGCVPDGDSFCPRGASDLLDVSVTELVPIRFLRVVEAGSVGHRRIDFLPDLVTLDDNGQFRLPLDVHRFQRCACFFLRFEVTGRCVENSN